MSYGGAPVGYAYGTNPGWTVGHWTCLLVRTRTNGTQYPIGMYFSGDPDCGPPDTPASDRYEVREEFWTIA